MILVLKITSWGNFAILTITYIKFITFWGRFTVLIILVFFNACAYTWTHTVENNGLCLLYYAIQLTKLKVYRKWCFDKIIRKLEILYTFYGLLPSSYTLTWRKLVLMNKLQAQLQLLVKSSVIVCIL